MMQATDTARLTRSSLVWDVRSLSRCTFGPTPMNALFRAASDGQPRVLISDFTEDYPNDAYQPDCADLPADLAAGPDR